MPIKKRSNEKQPEFIQRCISIEVGNGMDAEQAIVVCYGYWKENLADRQKVSIDYDGTLETIKGTTLVKRLINEGKSVYIITARQDYQMGIVYEKAKRLGISKNKIFNTKGKDKWEIIKRLGIGTHYDNNLEQIKKINDNTDAKGILLQ